MNKRTVTIRDSGVVDGDAIRVVCDALSPVERLGTCAAKENGMLTLSAFVFAVGSVFASVAWACKDETPTSA